MSKFEANSITWFEIPATDINRARGFYENLLNSKLIPYPGGEPCFIFPAKEDGVTGCIVNRPQSQPAADGTLIFLNVDGQLNAAVERAHTAGAKLLVPRKEIPGGHGFFAVLIDSEGNHVGLHTRGN
jgi:hypothetical protein